MLKHLSTKIECFLCSAKKNSDKFNVLENQINNGSIVTLTKQVWLDLTAAYSIPLPFPIMSIELFKWINLNKSELQNWNTHTRARSFVHLLCSQSDVASFKSIPITTIYVRKFSFIESSNNNKMKNKDGKRGKKDKTQFNWIDDHGVAGASAVSILINSAFVK